MSQVPRSQWVNLTATIQYSMYNKGDRLSRDKLRISPDLLWGPIADLTSDPISAISEVIPNQDSVLLSVLNHPTGNRDETDFAGYDPSTSTASPSVDGPDAV